MAQTPTQHTRNPAHGAMEASMDAAMIRGSFRATPEASLVVSRGSGDFNG